MKNRLWTKNSLRLNNIRTCIKNQNHCVINLSIVGGIVLNFVVLWGVCSLKSGAFVNRKTDNFMNKVKLGISALAAFVFGCGVCLGGNGKEITVNSVKVGGYGGGRIDDCFRHRVKEQDVDEIVEPFRHRIESWKWNSEFWGKWTLGAIGAYRYTGDAELYAKIAKSVDEIIETQTPDGYIGNYPPENQLKEWDIWGRKYTMLGLLSWYELTGERKALDAAAGVADHLLSQVGPGKTNIVLTGGYRGMPSSSVLEPIMSLYNKTGEQRYLDFAKYIVTQWETPEGPQLISKADVPVALRFPHPARWFNYANGQKAYEMMSCYEGLLEFYKVTGNNVDYDAVLVAYSHILAEEINIAGSGSAVECWYGGKSLQTVPTYHTMETCVGFTWMQFCSRLLAITGDSRFADNIERTFYNAILGSLKDDGCQIAKYTPLEGWRVEGERQCGLNINCCNANGPRAFAMIPSLSYVADKDCLTINFYGESEAEISLGKRNRMKVVQTGNYPAGGDISIEIAPDKAADFPVALRLPEWSRRSSARVISGADTLSVKLDELTVGEYAKISRRWKKGDRIELGLDMTARVVEQNMHYAITRGPLVLARDSRFGDGFVDEGVVIKAAEDGSVELTPAGNGGFAWMAFTVPMVAGTDLENNGKPRQIHLCDFASAGNTWDKSVRYRVWLPKTLNVMKGEYRAYNDGPTN